MTKKLTATKEHNLLTNMKEKKDNKVESVEPFVGPLKDIKFDESDHRPLRFSESYPKRVIRAENYSKKEEAIERAKEARKLFGELKKYGINVGVDFVVGQDRQQFQVYAVADKIIGTNLNILDGSEGDERLRGLLLKLYKGLIDYILDKYKTNEYFLDDILYGNQYVYGLKDGEAGKQIYLVDVDIFTAIPDGKYELSLLVDEILDTGTKFGVDLRQVKEHLLKKIRESGMEKFLSAVMKKMAQN